VCAGTTVNHGQTVRGEVAAALPRTRGRCGERNLVSNPVGKVDLGVATQAAAARLLRRHRRRRRLAGSYS